MKNWCRLVLGLYLLSVTMPLWAVPIEGTTPSGKFKAVFVTEQGRLPIAIDTTTLQHVVVDTGTITAYQGGPWSVTTSIGSSLYTIPSTTTLTVTAAFTCTTVPVTAYPADTARKNGVLCNNEDSINMWIGDSLSQAKLLPPSSCYSPDNPTAHVGALFCRSTATASGDYIYHK